MIRGGRAALRLGACTLALTSCLAGYAAAQDKPQAQAKPQDNVLLQANEIIYNAGSGVVAAEGHVEIDYGGRILLADRVSYDQKKDTVTAEGNVSLMAPNGDVAFANHVSLSDNMRDGALEGFSALIGKNGRMFWPPAVRGPRVGIGRVKGLGHHRSPSSFRPRPSAVSADSWAVRISYRPKSASAMPRWNCSAYRCSTLLITASPTRQ